MPPSKACAPVTPTPFSRSHGPPWECPARTSRPLRGGTEDKLDSRTVFGNIRDTSHGPSPFCHPERWRGCVGFCFRGGKGSDRHASAGVREGSPVEISHERFATPTPRALSPRDRARTCLPPTFEMTRAGDMACPCVDPTGGRRKRRSHGGPWERTAREGGCPQPPRRFAVLEDKPPPGVRGVPTP